MRFLIRPIQFLFLSVFLVTVTDSAVSNPPEGDGGLGLKSNLDLPFDAGGDSEDDDELAPEIIVFYGDAYEVSAVVFCLDESKSMKHNNRWELQQREVAKAVSELSPEAELGLVVYARGVSSFRPNLVYATQDNKTAVISFLVSRTLKGGTCVGDAVIKSLQMLQRAKSKYRAVIVAGDGGATQRCQIPPNGVQQTLAYNPGRSIKVHTILVGRSGGRGADYMREMAQTHGGTFRSVNR